MQRTARLSKSFPIVPKPGRPKHSSAGDVLLLALYIAAIVTANWLVTRFGQAALPYTAFLLIPFDLIIRDLFQDRWQAKHFLRLRMGLLIALGACISLATSTGSLRVNLASLTAFSVAGLIDALTYQRMIRRGRIFRINGATIIAAVTDSVIFALIAFDHASWRLAVAQSLMKIAGGFVWSLVMYRFFRRQTDYSDILRWTSPKDLANMRINEWPALETTIVPSGNHHALHSLEDYDDVSD